MEDAHLLHGAEYRDEIDIQLIQLQVLVTDRNGDPARDLGPADFEIRDGGIKRPVENLHTARDVPLVLGLAIDTSDSIVPIWQQVERPCPPAFLRLLCRRATEAFVVDFAGTVRLASELTGYELLLQSRVRSLAPRLGTALNERDSVLPAPVRQRTGPTARWSS